MNRDLQEIWDQVDLLPLCQTKVALIEQGIGLADTLNDLEHGYNFRLELVNCTNFTGDNDKALVAFAWLLAISDRYPEKFPEAHILWSYKWMITNVLDFPSISRAQIEETMADLALRFERQGPSSKPILALRCKIAREFGEWDQVKHYLTLWRKAPRVGLSDCLACDRNSMAQMNGALKRYKTGLKIAEPILTGKLSCNSVPHNTYAYFLEVLVRLGRHREALRFHELGYPLVKDDSGHVSDIARHLIFLVLIQDLAKATQVFNRHLGLCLASRVPSDRFHFFRAGVFLLRQLAKSPSKFGKLQLSGRDLPWRGEKTSDSHAALGWMEKEARTLAEQFDARNGHSRNRDELDGLVEMEELIRPLD